jgi:uncharacterized membrane protein (UPF0182 family)
LAGRVLIAATLLFFGFMSLYAEALWFQSVGYEARFWTVVLAKTGISLAAALTGAVIVLLLTRRLPRGEIVPWSIACGGAIGAIWGFTQWDVVLRYFNGVPMSVSDPIFGTSWAIC